MIHMLSVDYLCSFSFIQLNPCSHIYVDISIKLILCNTSLHTLGLLSWWMGSSAESGTRKFPWTFTIFVALNECNHPIIYKQLYRKRTFRSHNKPESFSVYAVWLEYGMTGNDGRKIHLHDWTILVLCDPVSICDNFGNFVSSPGMVSAPDFANFFSIPCQLSVWIYLHSRQVKWFHEYNQQWKMACLVLLYVCECAWFFCRLFKTFFSTCTYCGLLNGMSSRDEMFACFSSFPLSMWTCCYD